MHKLLLRQLKRHYGSIDVVPEELRQFLETIDATYHQFDDDRALLERSMELASQELLERNQHLRQDIVERRRSEEALRESEARYHAVVAQAAEGIYLADAHTKRFLETNTAYQNMLGYTAEELLQLTLYDVIAHDHESIDQNAQRVLKQEYVAIGERQHRRKDGSLVDVEVNISLIFHDGREITCAVVHDITERKRAEQELRESEERYRAVIEQATEAIFLVDADSKRILEANAAFQKLLGYGDEEIARLTIYDLLPYDRERIDRTTQRILDQGHYPVSERSYRHKDGTLVDIELSITPISAGGRQVLCQSLRDITERKRTEETLKQSNKELELRVAERTLEIRRANERLQRELNERRLAQEALRLSEERHRTLLQSLPQRVFFKDRQSTFVLVNTTYASDLGMRPQDLIGRTDFDIHPKELAEKYRADDVRVMTTRQVESLQEVNTISDPEGQGEVERVVEIVKAPVIGNDDEVLGVLGLFTDITERKRAEEALEQAMAETENANRAKSEFLSRMSHELRTPLNSILGFSQLLRLDCTTPEQQESVNYIIRGGKHLLELINEVLDIARIETGKLTISPEPVSLVEVLQECLDLVRPMAAQRKLTLQTGGSLQHDWQVMVDRQRLKQVLLNLLANAVKYNREGGSVILGCEKQSQSRIRIYVSDTGPGISSEMMSRLFIPFDRLGAEQSGVEGTGLGLALSKHLMQLMGGSIGVNSKVGEGSTFWVEMPLAEDQVQLFERARTGPLMLAQIPIQEHKILYIEDNLSNLKLVERILAHRPDIQLVSATQGGLGIDLARKHHPDLILLDLHLPDISGEEVLRRLQQNPDTGTIPVVVLSADATPRQIERILANGARAYLTKPLNLQQFTRVLGETLTSPTH